MILGIDLGTTNSLIAVWENDQVKVIPNALGKLLTPSVISIYDDSILIGEPALNRMLTHPDVTVANFKRFMGTDKVFRLGKFSFRPEELSSLILKRLKEDAEAYLQHPIEEAVISVPAYFSDAQRKATKTAAKLAGLNVERLINEPTAAGIAYGLQEETDETNYFVFDLGGGTFDVSILKLFSGIIEVCASCGDNLLGGIDFTHVLFEMFADHLRKLNHLASGKIGSMIREKIYNQAELAKRNLSVTDTVEMKIVLDSTEIKFHCSLDDFEQYANPLVDRLKNPIKKVLNDSKLTSSQIQQVVLVGGASRMPLIRKLVSRMFGRLPLSHLDPDTVIVQGAAIQAGLKSKNKSLDDIIVTDVCPYSLGVAVHSEDKPQQIQMYFDPIIERNTVIPTSRSKVYYTKPHQPRVEIKIFQGESLFLEKNVYLGDLKFNLPANAENRGLEIRFTYDINGLLEVEACILATGEKSAVIIEGNPGVLSEEQIQLRFEKLKEIKIHPRDKSENLLLLSQAERLYEDLHGEKREFFSHAIREFITALHTQNDTVIKDAKAYLENLIEEWQIKFELE
jgi:molecular chaperone HscC